MITIKAFPKDLVIDIQGSGEVEYDDLYRQIRKWEASTEGMVYSRVIDVSGNESLPNGTKSPKIMTLLGGWKLRSTKQIYIIGGIINGKGSDGDYNPISIDSKENITILRSIDEWKVSEDLKIKSHKLGELFGNDWEVNYSARRIHRKKGASQDKHRVMGMYWHLKIDRLNNEKSRPYNFPLIGDNLLPLKGRVRKFELLPDWTINKEDLRYLDGELLMQGDKILVQPSFTSTIYLRDRTDIEPVMGVRDLADEFGQIIENMSPEPGRMIGIFGKWGRGKTFFLNSLWEVLNLNVHNIKVELHAWKYQDTPAIWAYLYENFANVYFSSSNNVFHKIYKKLKINFIRNGWRSFWTWVITVAISAALIFLLPINTKIDLIWNMLKALGLGTTVSVLIFYFQNRNTARELFKIYYADVTFENILGIQAEVEKELNFIIRAMTSPSWVIFTKENWKALKSLKLLNLSFKGRNKKKVILFVDDIDRCSENKIIQIIDSLRVMLEDDSINRHLIVITAIDGDILERSIRAKYHHMVSLEFGDEIQSINDKLQSLTSEYLDKLFITGIKLGKLSSSEINEFFSELTKNDVQVDIAAPQTQEVNNIENKNNQEEEPSVIGQNPAISGNINTRRENRIKISPYELEIILKNLQKISDTTPRQIRIIYFRYLLAKNLLDSTYKNKYKRNIWTDGVEFEVFIELIIKYSRERALLNEDIINVHDNPSENIEVREASSSVTKEDYEILLKILDLVVAY